MTIKESGMSNGHSLLKVFSPIGLVLTIAVSMNADAGLFGFGGASWKEEALLHDGSKIDVERSQSRGGRGEIGQSPIKEHSITFTLPGTNKTITWKDEYSEDVGHSNFDLLALHILNGTPYIVASPYGCLAYNKWGRPNPPYVFFKHDGKTWQRISPSEFPLAFKEINLVINASAHEKELDRLSLTDADRVKEFNSSLRQPEFKTILREAVKGMSEMCIKTDYYGKAGWLSPDWFSDQRSYKACLMFCEDKGISPQDCPCKTLYKGAK